MHLGGFTLGLFRYCKYERRFQSIHGPVYRNGVKLVKILLPVFRQTSEMAGRVQSQLTPYAPANRPCCYRPRLHAPDNLTLVFRSKPSLQFLPVENQLATKTGVLFGPIHQQV